MQSWRLKLLNELIFSIEKELAELLNAAAQAHEAATHEESRSEDKHDTRGIEASYLAGAQAKRASDIERELSILRSLNLEAVVSGQPIQCGHIVGLKQGSKIFKVMLLLGGAGYEVNHLGTQIKVITPRAPLGEALMNQKAGDTVEVDAKDGTLEYEILEII